MAYSARELAANSARAACFHVATSAPLATPAKKKGRSCEVCHALATGMRSAIQTRMMPGHKPMGRRPPSVLGSMAMITTPIASGHSPRISQRMRMRSRAIIAARERRRSARGWIWSQPKPVLGTSDSQAQTKALTHSGGKDSPSNSSQAGPGSRVPTRQTVAHLAASASTAC